MRSSSQTRSVGSEAPLVLSLTVLLTVASLTSPRLAISAGFGMFLLTVVSWRQRMRVSASFGVLFVTFLGLGLAGVGPQQVTFSLAFLCYGVVVSRVMWLRNGNPWCAMGRIDARIMTIGVAFAALSGASCWRGT